MGTTQIITKLKTTPSLILEPSSINGELWHRKTTLKAFKKKPPLGEISKIEHFFDLR